MDPARLRALLEDVARGTAGVDDALRELQALPFRDLGFAKVDHHRALRTGFPEVVLGEGKETEHLVAVMEELAAAGSNVLCTRASPAQAQAVQARLPAAVYHALPRLLCLIQRPIEKAGATVGERAGGPAGEVLVVSAGTSDLRVAEEAALVAEHFGCEVGRLYDVGVAGLHRLLTHAARLQRARVLIVVAGMEGALPSVVAGLAGRPVIAVPTSVGYGAAFGGLAAMLGMLTACAAGVMVVNIDNGFGAGYAAALIGRGAASI